MARGDHVVRSMDVGTHHGIDVGDGSVVHWSTGPSEAKGSPGKIGGMERAEVRQTSLAEFAAGRPVWVRTYRRCHGADAVVARARARVGQRGYDLAENNCEHFACWCKTGQHKSAQVRDVAAAIVGTTVTIGVVGAGPAAGLAGLIGLPALASALTLRSLLPEEGARTTAEREARAAGRAAGIGSAVVAMVSALVVVAAAGLPGLSAAGIATGLAAIGGGSAGAGLAAMLVFPAAVALGAGWLAYRLGGGGRDPSLS
jgi:Lecithin retinol acyltransferase